MKRILLLFSLMLVALTASSASATGHFFHGNLTDNNISDEAVDQYLRDNFDIDENTVFWLVNDKTDEQGTRHLCYQQYNSDVRVESGRVLAHSKDGILYAVNGCVIEKSEAPSTASLMLRSQNDFGGELVIASKQTPDGVVYIPAYKVFDFTRMADVYIDAASGEEFKVISKVYNMTAEVNTMYDGAQTFEVELSGDKYVLTDAERKIYTLNASAADYKILDGMVWDTLNIDDDKAVTDSVIKAYVAQCSEIAYDGPMESNCVLSSFIMDTYPEWYSELVEDQDTVFKVVVKNADGIIVGDTAISVPSIQISERILKMYVGLFGKMVLEPGCRLHFTTEKGGRSLTGDDGILLQLDGGYLWMIDEGESAGASGSYSTPDLVSAANQAHWGMKGTYDFYSEVFNLKSYDGKGSTIYQFVNPIASGFFDGIGLPDNAAACVDYYNEKVEPYREAAMLNLMVYGLGDGRVVRPMVALDVMAHEFTHLVTYNNGHGGLNYIGESGALNESFSDIMGFSVENYLLGDKDYLHGEDVMVNVSNSRNMKDPKLSGQVACPDTYKGEHWVFLDEKSDDNGGVHINSGVQNKWYYLMNEGGSGTNDLGNAYEVEGIGIANGRKIAFRNLMTYMIPVSDFSDARDGALQAAVDLYGRNSKEYIAVMNAWHAVGVGDDYDPTAIEENAEDSSDKTSASVYVSEGVINVSSPEATDVMIYATDGSILYSADNVSETEYAAPGKGVYIVRAGEQVVKVSVK